MQQEAYSPTMIVPMPMGGSESQADQVSAEAMQMNRVENIIAQLNPENLLVDIEHRLKRMRKDTFTGNWVPIQKDQKEVSPELIANIISYLSPFLTNNTTFSNYIDTEINKIMTLVIDDMIEDLCSNAEKYGIDKDYAERNRITEIVCTSIYSAMKRAMKGQEATKFWKALSIKGNVDQIDDTEKKSRWRDWLKIG